MTKKNRLTKDFTYTSIIKEAILNTRDAKATSNEIFEYVKAKHPSIFRESNSLTWKNNIRQLLSKNPEFIKIPKSEGHKLHYWKYQPMSNDLSNEIYDKENTKNAWRDVNRGREYRSDQYIYTNFFDINGYNHYTVNSDSEYIHREYEYFKKWMHDFGYIPFRGPIVVGNPFMQPQRPVCNFTKVNTNENSLEENQVNESNEKN